tara:strand:- start:1405 stop:2451 length:1047 start_codon:yes stop_codon:yes gene_type:complete
MSLESSFLPKRYFKIGYARSKNEEYSKFCNKYIEENYKFKQTSCLCKKNNDQPLSEVDRHGCKFKLVICKSCGLIRAKYYFDDISLDDFYTNHYRRIVGNDKITPIDFYQQQKRESKKRWSFLKKSINQDLNNKFIIFDCGGGAGGNLDGFINRKNLYLSEYYEPYIEFAKSKGINTIKGGLKEFNKLNIKPNLIILSHVVEHWSNFDNEITELIKCLLPNTYIYIEFPGIDSIKLGRRGYDFLGEIHNAHIYYFASYVFINLLNRRGFKCLVHTAEFYGLFKYSSKKTDIINYYHEVRKDLIKAEKKRLLELVDRKSKFIQKILKKILPRKLIRMLKKIKGDPPKFV